MERDEFGCYRSLEPPGVLPQNCRRLDNTPVARPGERLVDVDVLNVDSASFRQLLEQASKESRTVEELVLEIVRDRGKLHNPVTGSGGMLLGRLEDGRRIVTLVSLSLTPLHLETIHRIDPERDRLYVTGRAVLFQRTLYCPLPEDLNQGVALAALDVAGAPSHAVELSRKAENVLLIGAGKAGMLTAAALRRRRPQARLLVLDSSRPAVSHLADLGLCDWSRVLDAREPLEAFEAVMEATSGHLADLTLNLVNQAGTEGSAVLCTRDGGTICFFSMATSFSRAALTAEGAARDVRMLIGSGYRPGWADDALNLLRENQPLRRAFEELYGE